MTKKLKKEQESNLLQTFVRHFFLIFKSPKYEWVNLKSKPIQHENPVLIKKNNAEVKETLGYTNWVYNELSKTENDIVFWKDIEVSFTSQCFQNLLLILRYPFSFFLDVRPKNYVKGVPEIYQCYNWKH